MLYHYIKSLCCSPLRTSSVEGNQETPETSNDAFAAIETERASKFLSKNKLFVINSESIRKKVPNNSSLDVRHKSNRFTL